MNCNAKMAFSSRSRYIRRSSGPGMNWRESMSHASSFWSKSRRVRAFSSPRKSVSSSTSLLPRYSSSTSKRIENEPSSDRRLPLQYSMISMSVMQQSISHRTPEVK